MAFATKVREWIKGKEPPQVYTGGKMCQPFLSSLTILIVPSAGPSAEGSIRAGQM